MKEPPAAEKQPMLDAIVIGAGAAGIAAARRLSGLGLTYRVLEAKAVAGGRAMTDNDTFGVPIDLGCHWLHSPARNPLKPLADACGIRYAERALPTRYARGGAWLDDADQDACRRYVDAGFERIAAAGRAGADRPAAELFDGDSPWHPIFEAEFAAKQGVGLREGSTLDFARYAWEGDDLPVAGGLGNLLQALARDLPISFSAPVLRIDRTSREAVRVATTDGHLEARAAVVTVSMGVLAAGAITFAPPLPESIRAAIEALPMGSCNKIVLGFERPVFGDLAPCLVVPQRRASESVELVMRPGGAELAVCMVNGDLGRALSRAGADAMAACALDCLVEIFGAALRRAAGPRLIADWDGDPHVRGAYAAALPGRADAALELLQPLDGRLWFAGEALHPEFTGDAHGAWLSGIDAAEAVAHAMGKRTD
jgi:monoamine oxidase